jgi:hypothetical protein
VLVTRTLTEKGRGQDSALVDPGDGRREGLSQSSVSRIWRAFGLKPHVVETWKLSTDPEFIGKVRDVVGLYMSPPENALVLCVDEKSQIQALDRTAPCLPMLPTTPARMTHDYVRNGTTSLFAALRPGQRLGHRPALPPAPPPGVPAVPQADRHRRPERPGTAPGAGQLRHPQDPAIHQWLLKHPRFHLHFTPTSSSWMNLVERWFAELTNRKLRRSAHRSVTELETDIRTAASPNSKRHPQVDQRVEQEPQAVRLDQDRRRDPRNPRRLLPTNHRLRTLGVQETAALSDRLADAARAVPGDGDRSWALGEVARATPALAADLVGEALAAARATADPEERAEVLTLLTDLPGSGQRDELLEEALSAARCSDSDDARCRALAMVSRHLPSPHRRSVLNELLKDALACPPGPGQTDRLAVLAPHLTKTMLDKAVPGVLAVQPEEDRARLLVSYAPSLPDHLRADFLRATTEIRDEFSRGEVIQALAPFLTGPLFFQALSAAGRISDAYIRSRCVGALADRLPDQFLGQALSLVRSTSSQSGAARFLLGIANRAEEPRRTELLQEALAMARSATDASTRAQALGDISASLERG